MCTYIYIKFHAPCISNVVLIDWILCRESGSACVHKSKISIAFSKSKTKK